MMNDTLARIGRTQEEAEMYGPVHEREGQTHGQGPRIETQVSIRVASPADGEGLRGMFLRSSSETIYRRFHLPYPEVPEWMLALMLDVDHHGKGALVAVADEQIVGHAMYARLGDDGEAEMAIVVEDGWQSKGVGKLLLRELAEEARSRGVETFVGTVLTENRRMLGLIGAVFTESRRVFVDGVSNFRVPLRALKLAGTVRIYPRVAKERAREGALRLDCCQGRRGRSSSQPPGGQYPRTKIAVAKRGRFGAVSADSRARSWRSVTPRRADELSDEQLMARVAGPEVEAALSTLYDRYSRTIFGVGSKLLGDSSLAEELVQEVFLRVWRSSHTFDPSRSSFSTWVYRVTRNAALDLYRKRARAVRSVSDGDVHIAATWDSSPGPQEIVDDSWLSWRVSRALEELDVAHREVIELAYFQGLSQREISLRTGIPLGTVKTRTASAFKRLRKELVVQDTSRERVR